MVVALTSIKSMWSVGADQSGQCGCGTDVNQVNVVSGGRSIRSMWLWH